MSPHGLLAFHAAMFGVYLAVIEADRRGMDQLASAILIVAIACYPLVVAAGCFILFRA